MAKYEPCEWLIVESYYPASNAALHGAGSRIHSDRALDGFRDTVGVPSCGQTPVEAPAVS
jgi:hypothetical protein